jgi:putative FmdB family regulatory protein
MPTYEYACKQCGEHLEVVQSFKDEPLSECPACKGPLRKVFGNIGIAFKGSGFYKTDSRSSAGAAKPAAGTSGSPSSEGSSSPGSDSGGSGGSTPAKSDTAASTPAKTGSGSGSGSTSKPAAPSGAAAS